jgi:hypothetical protein
VLYFTGKVEMHTARLMLSTLKPYASYTVRFGEHNPSIAVFTFAFMHSKYLGVKLAEKICTRCVDSDKVE